ncbi:MAG: hypothetical protein V7739_09025 [Motiliproteus sp.]
MSRIRDIELPDEVIEVFRDMVLAANDSEIMAHAKVDKGLVQGMRLVKSNAPKLRERFAERVCVKKATMPTETVQFLSRVNPISIFGDLSEDTIRNNIDPLCSVLGRGEVLASLLLGAENYQKIAVEVIEGDLVLNEVPVKQAKTFASGVWCNYAPFLDLLHRFTNEGESGFDATGENSVVKKATVNDSQVKAQNEKIRNLEAQLKDLRIDIKKHKKEAVRADELAPKLARSERQCEELKQNIKDLEGRLLDSSSKYVSLETEIASKVDEEVHSKLHNWIAGPVSVGNEVARGLNGIADTARSLIDHQQQRDRNSGNRKELRDRIEELTGLRDQMQDLSVESINPLPQLAAIAEELDREICRIESALGSKQKDSIFVRGFMERIGQAETPEDIFKLKKLLGQLTQNAIVTHTEARTLFECCDRRISLAYDKYTPEVTEKLVPIDPFYRLKRSIAKNNELIWLLDGHNILFSLPDVFGTFGADGKPTDTSRRALEQVLIDLVKDSSNVQVQLVFDSSDHSEYYPADNVKVVYSGGEGDHRADREICSHLEYCCYISPDTPTMLTSDDRDLRDNAERLGADLMWMDEFFALARSVI